MSSTPAPPDPEYGIGGVPDSDIRSQNPEYLTQSTPLPEWRSAILESEGGDPGLDGG